MINFITLVKMKNGMASYQVQDALNDDYLARLIKSNIAAPEEIRIEKTLNLKNELSVLDTLTNQLICSIMVNKQIDNSVPTDFLS